VSTSSIQALRTVKASRSLYSCFAGGQGIDNAGIALASIGKQEDTRSVLHTGSAAARADQLLQDEALLIS
jgi:hypothetical protein